MATVITDFSSLGAVPSTTADIDYGRGRLFWTTIVSLEHDSTIIVFYATYPTGIPSIPAIVHPLMALSFRSTIVHPV